MKKLIITLCLVTVIFGCSTNRLPDPYSGFEYSSTEQGYWKEITEDKESIGELHLHSKGFSVTRNPLFGTYKDYWGTYSLNEQRGQIMLTIDGGNYLPKFSDGSAIFQLIGRDQIRIAKLALDPRRPTKQQYHFERFHPNQ